MGTESPPRKHEREEGKGRCIVGRPVRPDQVGSANIHGVRCSLDVVMREQRGSFCTCPVTFFLATVLADDALEQSLTPEQLVSFAVPAEGSGFARLRWKKEKLEEPIFRDGNGAPVSYRLWLDQLSELGRRAGYVKGITPYHIRRGVANALDGKCSANTWELRLLRSDQNEGFRQHNDGSFLGTTMTKCMNGVIRAVCPRSMFRD